MAWFPLLVFLLLIPLIPTAYAGWIGAPYAPTRIAVVKKAFDQFGVGEGDLLVDLGAGDGKILLAAAATGAQAVGYELSPFLWVVAKLRTWRNKKIKVRFANFYKKKLPDATVVFSFLMPEKMGNVRKLIRKNVLPRGKFFMTYAFPFKDVVPLRVIQAPKCAPVYVYDLKDVASE